MASDPDFEPQQRLHPLSWLFALTAYIKQLIVPVLAFLIFGARNDAELWSVLIIVPLVIGALWHQWVYRYGFGPRGLVIHDGLFFRNVRQIEYPRIENIDVERGVLHRLFGVAQVSIATSTGGKPEASIRVLGLEAVQELRERIFDRASPHLADAAAAPDTHTDETLLHLPPAELVRYGLIDNRGMLVVAAIFGFAYQLGAGEITGATVDALLEALQLDEFAALGITLQVAVVLAAVISFVLSLRLFSIVLALITFFDFTLARHGPDFRIRHGLLTRVALTLRVRRIQAVHRSESLLERWFKRVSLRVDLAGDTGSSDGKQQSKSRTRWLAPLCTQEQAAMLMAAALPDVDLREEPDWQPLAPRARGRLFRQGMYVGSALLTAASLALHWLPESPFRPGTVDTLAAIALLIPLTWARAHIYVKYTRWAQTRDAILFRDGWLTRRLIVVPRARLQSVSLRASPFDRRHAMASVAVDTAGGHSMQDSIRIRMLPQDVAQRLVMNLYRSPVTSSSPLQPSPAATNT